MAVDWNDYDAVLFDLDGVITPTAEVHMHAWAAMFNDVPRASTRATPPYTDPDYFDHVDGKPRYDGVRDFLASRGIELPEGSPGRSARRPRPCAAWATARTTPSRRCCATTASTAYPGSVALLRAAARDRA